MSSRPLSPALACLLIACLGAQACCPFTETRYRGPATTHFDGERFFNPWGIEHHDFKDLVRFLASRRPVEWEADQSAAARDGPLPERAARGELRVTFVNHSTVLIQMDGCNVLTDPVWSERIGPGTAFDLPRKRPPGIRLEQLPRIDLVLISHNHYDHMDLATLRRLQRAFAPEFLVGLGDSWRLREKGIGPVRELDWWQSVTARCGVEVVGVPAQHFSNRGLCDRDRSLWLGYVLRSDAGNVYFAGDTGWAPHFAEIGRRLAPIRLALLPIGAAEPRWFMQPVHTDAYDVVRAHRRLGAALSMVIHFGTFQQGDDGEFDPVALLAAAIGAAGEPIPRFWVPDQGESRRVP